MYEYGDGLSILEIVAIVGFVVFAFFVWFLLRLMASTIKVLKQVSQWLDAKTDHTEAKAQLVRQRIRREQDQNTDIPPINVLDSRGNE